MPPRLLIVTAAFGEGHNSAARNLAIALESEGAEARVSDPCMEAAPWTTRALSGVYRYLTNHMPSVWAAAYRSTDRRDFNRQRLPLMRKPEKHLRELLETFAPDAVISTYPIYPYFLKRAFDAGRPRIPVFTVVTDSMAINSAWLRAPSDGWIVSDAFTRERVLRAGIEPQRVAATGFPVHPAFSQLAAAVPDDRCAPFRVLFFPTARRRRMADLAVAALNVSPEIRLTLVMGKNLRHLNKAARQLKRDFPHRVRLLGWTRRVPQLLTSHHLVIGKAGGATVHEAIAARCPMLIHHLVPGQEEGNLELLEKIGGGTLASTPSSIRSHLADMLADHCAGWRTMKHALARHGHQDGAIAAARHILRSI